MAACGSQLGTGIGGRPAGVSTDKDPYRSALLAITVIGAAARATGLFNDLWLDEIWSIDLVADVTSPLRILTDLKHDNNHPLNSLYLFFLKGAAADWHYRLLAWVAGAATVWMAGLFGRHLFQRLHPRATIVVASRAGLLTAFVIALSYLQIQYSSEARGYAPAGFFSVVALYAMLRGATTSSGRWIALYWVACLLGILSHATFIPIQIAGLVLGVFDAVRRPSTWQKRLAGLIEWHLVPTATLVWYYLLFLQQMVIGGGVERAPLSVLSETAAFTTGLPLSLGGLLGVPLLAGVAIVALTLIARHEASVAIGLAIGLFCGPIAGALNPSRLFYPRYLLVSVTVLEILGGYLLARSFESGRRAFLSASTVLLLLAIGGILQTVRLLQFGRGQYRVALQVILNSDSDAPISVSSDNDFRNSTVINHHLRALSAANRVVYHSNGRLPSGGVKWFFRHDFADRDTAAATIVIGGAMYRLTFISRNAPPSGWNWYLYRRDE